MRLQGTRYGHVLRLEIGEEIIGSLTEYARAHGVRCGALSGIGACADAELGFFHPERREYSRRVFAGDHEIVALTGNLSELEGAPFPHCHIVLGDAGFACHAGHLFRATVSVTAEIQVVTDPGVLRRMRRTDLGFNPLDPDAG